MKAERLKSGKWRVRVYLGEIGGKRRWKSITGRTKAEALRLAEAYDPEEETEIQLREACRKYIDIRGKELSPSTVRGYDATLRTMIEKDPIGGMPLSEIKTRHVQAWISRMPRSLSSKTKKNHLGFLAAVVGYYVEGRRFRVKIADRETPELYTPTADEIMKVVQLADPETKTAILLGIFGLRRGEICALTAEDLDRRRNLVRICKSMVKDGTGAWIVKTPKTKGSVRFVEISQAVMDLMPDSGPVISCSPDCITNRFAHLVTKAGVPRFRFHDLRSFFASISVSSALGISERTVMEIGGWKTPTVLRQHYERSISDQRRKDTDRLMEYYTSAFPV